MKGRPDDLERLRHMVEAIDRIDEFTEKMDLAAFQENEMAQFAVIKNFEIIGEAVYHISKELKEKYAKIEWRKIEGMRHVLVHDYYRVNNALLWNTKEEKLVDLRIQVEEILEKADS